MKLFGSTKEFWWTFCHIILHKSLWIPFQVLFRAGSSSFYYPTLMACKTVLSGLGLYKMNVRVQQFRFDAEPSRALWSHPVALIDRRFLNCAIIPNELRHVYILTINWNSKSKLFSLWYSATGKSITQNYILYWHF